MPRVRFEAGIVCDDIRIENNGKLIAIGIYGVDIRLPEIPSGTTLSFLVVGTAIEDGDIKIEFRAQVNDSPVLKIEAGAGVRGGRLMIPVSNVPIVLNQEGRMVLEARNIGEKDWQNIGELVIGRAPQATVSISPQQPSGQSPTGTS